MLNPFDQTVLGRICDCIQHLLFHCGIINRLINTITARVEWSLSIEIAVDLAGCQAVEQAFKVDEILSVFRIV